MNNKNRSDNNSRKNNASYENGGKLCDEIEITTKKFLMDKLRFGLVIKLGTIFYLNYPKENNEIHSLFRDGWLFDSMQ